MMHITADKSESEISDAVRLEAAKHGFTLWRNNVGVSLCGERPIRFGLANDSAKINARIKSSDYVGWREIEITQDMVGTRIAQFASVEMKRGGWEYTARDREVAQKRWIDLVNNSGGYGIFANDVSCIN